MSLRYEVWFHGQGRRPRRPRRVYSGSDSFTADAALRATVARMGRGRVCVLVSMPGVDGPRERCAFRRGAR